MHITREDRWKDVLDKLKYGQTEGLESARKNKNNKFVYIGGRKITPKEAYFLSGISPKFFFNYIGKEVPVEDIMTRLDEAWTRKKVRQLKVENLLK